MEAKRGDGGATFRSPGGLRQDLMTKYLGIVRERARSVLSTDELSGLFLPRGHQPVLVSRRIGLISSRVRLVAALFALLTPLWIVIDLWVFFWPIWPQLAVMRMVASFAFGLLAFSGGDRNTPARAYRELALLFAIPITFFVASHSILSHYRMEGAAEAIATGYAFLPFVMVAGLSVFPLTAFEGLLYSLPILAVEAGAALLGRDGIEWSSHLGAVWLLLLIAVVATLAGMSQLSFMMALVRQATRDPLTGCFTRSCGAELLDAQFKLASRSREALSLAFVDLDDFKTINDRYGHEMGDQVLSGAAQAMARALRSSDIQVRWGGEEFLLILPHTGRDAAVEVVERLRADGLGARPEGRPMSASFGIAEYPLDRTCDWRELVEIADRRMYLAKQSGKNRWIASG